MKFLEQQNFNLMAQLRKLRESVMSVRITFIIYSIAKPRLELCSASIDFNFKLPKSGHACALGVVFFSLFVFCYPGGTGPLMLLSETENFELTRLDAFKSRRILQVDAAGID